MAWALVLVPLAGAALAAALGRRSGAPGAVASATLALTLVLGVWAAAARWSGGLVWSGDLGLSLQVAGISRMMVVLVPAIALPVVVYAAASEAGDPGLGRLLALLVAFVGAMELLAAAADFLTLLGAWELVGACSWALIGHHWRDRATAPAAAQAYLTTRVGDVGLFLAATAAFAASRSSAFAALPARGWQLDVVAAGLLVAAAAKSAQLPSSPWLFSAMAGPTPVSALLHSATMVAAGAFALAKLAPAFSGLGWFGPVLSGLGVATAVAGGVVASVQTDLKRALAASTSAQYGLMFAAIGAGATAAAGAHLVTHAVFKSLLFLGAGVAIHAVGSGDLGGLRLGRSHRASALLFAVGAVALAAVPPSGGAASKDAVLAATGDRFALAGLGVAVAGLLSAFYATRLLLLAYGPGDRLSHTGGREPRAAGRAELVAMGVLATASLALSGLWLPGGRALIELLVGARLPAASAAGLAGSTAAVAAGVAGAWLLDRRGRLVGLGLAPRVQRVAGAWFGLPALARVLVVEPVLAASRFLAAVDDRVIDAGVRATARVAAAASHVLSWWSERGVDGVVWGVAASTLAVARGSRAADDHVVDATVEGLAGGIGVAGRHSRRLQTGLAHQYYVVVVVGLAALVAAAALGRF